MGDYWHLGLIHLFWIMSEVDKVGVSSWGLPAQVVLRAAGPWGPGLQGEGPRCEQTAGGGSGWPGTSRRVPAGWGGSWGASLGGGPSNYKKKPSALGWLLTCFECCCDSAGQDFSQTDGIFLARMNFFYLFIFVFEMSGLEVNTRVCCDAGGGEPWRAGLEEGSSPHYLLRGAI